MKLTFSLAIILLTCACVHKNTGVTTTSNPVKDLCAYTVKPSDHWAIDTSRTNTNIAIKALQAFEKDDTAEMRGYFADTLMAGFDGSSYAGPRNQFLALVKNERGCLKKVTNKYYDCLAVTSKDNSEQWITAWLLQISTDKNDKIDSAEYVYDGQFKNGKIIMWNKYVRHLKKI